MRTLLAPVILACLVCALASHWVARLATRLGIVAHPNPDVVTHTRVVPLLGGLAIVLGLSPWLLRAAEADQRWAFAMGAMLQLAALGLYKDRVTRPVSVVVQFIMQASAAALLVRGGFRLHYTPSIVTDALASAIVIVLIVNAWNFVDVADGLAASITIPAALSLALVATHIGDPLTASVAAAIAGTALGFLFHNRPPARLFMGDAGAFPLGLLIAAILLALAERRATGWAIWLLAFVPVLDVAFAASNRILNGRSPFAGGAEHISTRLLARGWSPWGLLAATWAVSVGAGLVCWWTQLQ